MIEKLAGGGLPRVSSTGDACCGCGACAAKCPRGCISMAPDAWGFLRPEVDASACVGCGACESVCPALAPLPADAALSVSWARARDAGLLARSSSGGVFGLLAGEVLAAGGVVCGAAWDDGCGGLGHALVDEASGLDAVMRSKYVQSSVGPEVYEGVRGALRAGRRVLFAGTACQVAGMRAYLGGLADSAPFLSVDVICHGAPSPELWRRWLGHLGAGAEARDVNFRDKRAGWADYSVAYDFGEGGAGEARRPSAVFRDDWYMRAFLANASLRPSCFGCPSKRACGSDVTLGDFWGVQEQHPEVECAMGVSAVVANTGRGEEALRLVAGGMERGDSFLEKLLPGNPCLVRSAEPFRDRDAFMQALADGVPISEMMRRWDFGPTLLQRVRGKLGIVKRAMKKALPGGKKS